MLIALLAALALAPIYWLIVPVSWRREAVTAASLAALTFYDWRLGAILLGLALALHVLLRWLTPRSRRTRWAVATLGFGGLVVLFVWNKTSAVGGGALSSQGGLVFLGLSYLALKVAAVLAERARGALEEVDLASLLGWLVFLPTYPSGPIEELAHFRSQAQTPDPARIGRGLERILFGLVKAVVLSSALAEWAQPALTDPASVEWPMLVLAVYAFTLRFYLDFSGFSDVAIGLGAVYGYEVQENFDRPLLRRNLVQLWQHWHMTLTRWLRTYLFIPISRGIMRRGGPRLDTLAIVVAQLLTMTFCGLWHGVSWNFALWGFVQAVGLIWVGLSARALGARLPEGWRAWWRKSRVAYALCVGLTFNAFAFSNVLLFSDFGQAIRILRFVLGAEA